MHLENVISFPLLLCWTHEDRQNLQNSEFQSVGHAMTQDRRVKENDSNVPYYIKFSINTIPILGLDQAPRHEDM
jgi:hypothetical protein